MIPQPRSRRNLTWKGFGLAIYAVLHWGGFTPRNRKRRSPKGPLMPPRILVLSASVGAGHLRAAEAVELALRQTLPDALVRNLDVLEMTNALFRRVYGKFYLDL